MVPPLDPESQIVAALRRIMRAVDLHSHRLLEEFGLTGPQLAVLQATARRRHATAGALAREVHISPATVTGIVTRLERRGLLRREPGISDRRQVHVELTAEGSRVLERAPSLLQDRFRERLETLEDWERTMILSVLQRIATLMDAEDLDASPHLVGGGQALDADVRHPAPNPQ